MVTRVRWILLPILLVALVALAALPLTRIFAGDLLPRLLIGAAAGAGLVGTLLARAPRWLVAPVTLVALAGYSVAVVSLSAQAAQVDGSASTLAVDALRNGIPRLLTALIPVEPQPDTVLVPVILTWLASFATVEFALRGKRLLLGLAPPTALYAAGLLIVGPNAPAQIWSALGFAALAAAALAVGSRNPIAASGAHTTATVAGPRRGKWVGRLRLIASASAVLLVVGAGTFVVAPAVAMKVGSAPEDPRQYVAPPVLDTLDVNPLVRLSGWGLDPKQDLLTVAVTGLGPDQETRLRLAVLSDYDGITWRLGGAYRSAGRTLPGDGGTATIVQRITISGLTGKLLPAIPTPRGVDGVRVGFDEVTGTIMNPDGLTPGTRYTVTSAVTPLEVNALTTADVPAGAAVARYLQLGTPPDQLTALADQIAGSESAPYSKALAIEQFLAEHYELVVDAASGHAYPNLQFFLLGNAAGGGRRGSTEQFSASFAALARMVGLPTRVAVGFTVHAGDNSITAGDAFAWPEVLFTGVGWVAFDPRPLPDTPPRPVEDDFQPKPSPPSDSPEAVPTVSLGPGPSARPSAAAEVVGPSAGGVDPILTAVATGGTGLLLFLGYLMSVPWLKRQQRNRRLLTGAPPDRIAYAWDEVRAALRLAGHPAPAHLTATELAAHAEPGNIRHLTRLINLVTFADYHPTEIDAAAARGEAVAYAQGLRRKQSWWSRLRWAFDPRPLRWHRRRR